MDDSSPFALLVNAASSAQTQRDSSDQETPGNQSPAGEASGSSSAAKGKSPSSNLPPDQQKSADPNARSLDHLSEAELHEAIRLEALQREEMQRRAAYMQGFPPQEAEYLQQLRLEALVQQRRQETLAQLALAQEAGVPQDINSLLEAQQLRHALLLRQHELLLGYPGGLAASQNSYGAIPGRNDENLLLQLYAERERERERNMANMASPTTITSAPGFQHGLSQAGSGGVAASGDAWAGGMPNNTIDDGSGSTVLPCRARGMPMDHNVKTAFFLIPHDIKHGTELVCSYYACRNAGIKFRYCTHCKLPVAKRNFCKRHKHDGKIPRSAMPEERIEDDASTSESLSGNAGEAKPSSTAAEPLEAGSILDVLVEQGVEELVPDDLVREPFSNEELKRRSRKRRSDWEHLLTMRPRSFQAAANWVQRVLAVSNLDSMPGSETTLIKEGAAVVLSEDASPAPGAGAMSKSMSKGDVNNSSALEIGGPSITQQAGKSNAVQPQTGALQDSICSPKAMAENGDDSKSVSMPEKGGGNMKDSQGGEIRDQTSGELSRLEEENGPNEMSVGGRPEEEDASEEESTSSSDESVDLRASKKQKKS